MILHTEWVLSKLLHRNENECDFNFSFKHSKSHGTKGYIVQQGKLFFTSLLI